MADLRPQYTEYAVGANHPTKSDVVNRAYNVEHNEDGTHNVPTMVTSTNVITDHQLIRGDGGVRGLQESTIIVSDDGEMTNPSQPAFQAYVTADQLNVTGDGTAYDITGAIWTEVYDQNNNFSNGTFTAPVDGVYLFSMPIYISDLAAAHTRLDISIVTSNRTFLLNMVDPHNILMSGLFYNTYAMHCWMDKDDTAYPRLKVTNGTKVVDLEDDYTRFSGHLVC